MKLGVGAIRLIHGLVSAYFLACLLYLYYSVILKTENNILYVAIISLLLEGTIVFINRNDCPLGVIHNRLGDTKYFFESFLPKKLAKKVIPISGEIAIIGIALFFGRKLLGL